jgi:outer membrane protein OmpA-like peptidoglycan-associated protein
VPGEIDVQARTTTGLPLDAEIRFVGAASGAPAPARLGPDGWASYQLPAGEWTVVLASPAFGTQERAILVEPGATHLLEVEARMAQDEGAGALLVEVVDPAGRAVGDADVQIDGVARGRTSNGGALRVGGLALGAHRVRVTASRIQDIEQEVQVTGPDGRVRLDTRWKPGTVTLRATAPGGPATDAMVMLSGVELRGPLAMDPRGELMLHLAPGAWNVFASSPRDGEGERDFAAPTSAPPPVIDIPVRPLPPPVASVPADLLVAVRDTDDAAVAGARVRVGDVVGTTGQDGAAVLEGLPPGSAPLGVAAEGYAPPPDEPLSLHAGPQQRTVRLRAEPREVEVRVSDRGAPPKPLDANLALEGRVPIAPRQTGDDGVERVSLLPGSWSMAVRADGVGADVRSVRVPAGTGPLPVDFRLGAAQVTVEGAAISLGAPIRFATGTARIDPVSDALLREVAAQLLLHPEFASVALRGHTDNVGDPVTNLLLSRQRSAAVRDRLVALGVPAERLVAEGYGDTVPVADNATEPGRQLNRRVEFVVLERR